MDKIITDNTKVNVNLLKRVQAWWCDEAPQTPIDDGLWILVIIALLIGIVYLITKYKDKEQLKQDERKN